MAYKNPLPSVDDETVQFSKLKERKTEDSSENDYTIKKLVYFAFIDVLGFKKTFDDNRKNDADDFADKYRKVFNYYFELMNAAKFMRDRKSTGCYAGQTSDSLYFYTSRIDILTEFIKIYSHFNLYAMSEDVFFRGGIAKGNLYIKEDYQFYGDSVIYAYLLESSISKNPIIVIDEKTYNDITKIDNIESLIITKKTRHYIKPFAFLENSFRLAIDDTFILQKIDVNKIRENILNNLNLFEYDSRNFEKYTFLIEELNALGIKVVQMETHKEEK